ncbi:MAG: serine--tRNA ligase [Candidatus Omnitrophica bacterium]|nr:serine--tRNA ligase [Candidatus Omnitrophota bacterium]
MLDLKFIRENRDVVVKALENRNHLSLIPIVDQIISDDNNRRKVLLELEELRAQRNKANDEIGALLREKKDAKEKITSMKVISSRVDTLEDVIRDIDPVMTGMLLTIPNIPHSSVPVGAPDKGQVVRTWGEPKNLNFKALTHIDLAQNLDIVDFTRATKIAMSNFVIFKGMGARLERALINFMLDLHTTKHGYTEILPPYLVNRKAMTGTGQLPKLEEDMYKLKDDDLFLIPTAEVPVTNMYDDEILDEDALPVCHAAYSACFRREAGSYGKDTKGLIRVHQFDKVEMVKFVKPETSYDEHEKLVANAETVLQLLGLPYRVLALSTQDISFAASKCYDLEAYAPGLDRWLEVSSCSNFEAFQARRANIKFRRKETKKLEFVHTLNGSGVAMARTVIAIMENYQQEDGSILIPDVLRPYMDGKERISKI